MRSVPPLFCAHPAPAHPMSPAAMQIETKRVLSTFILISSRDVLLLVLWVSVGLQCGLKPRPQTVAVSTRPYGLLSSAAFPKNSRRSS
jgi:hypothetical protein